MVLHEKTYITLVFDIVFTPVWLCEITTSSNLDYSYTQVISGYSYWFCRNPGSYSTTYSNNKDNTVTKSNLDFRRAEGHVIKHFNFP